MFLQIFFNNFFCCKLADVTPEDVIRDFTNNLDCGSWKREGKDLAKEHLISYFIAYGYGQQYYTVDDIRLMFKEMDAPGCLFPKAVGLVTEQPLV